MRDNWVEAYLKSDGKWLRTGMGKDCYNSKPKGCIVVRLGRVKECYNQKVLRYSDLVLVEFNINFDSCKEGIRK